MPIRIGLLICVLASTMVCGQAPGLADPPSTPAASFAAVTGIFNWIHSTADVDRGYAFYHEVFGLEMVNAPFGAIPGAPPPNTIRSRAEAIADPIIGNLTNTNGARFRNVFMRLPGAEFGLELSEFNDIESKSVRPNFWDPGATGLILQVRDLEKVFAALRSAGAQVITLGAAPVDIRARNRRARSILVRDPDGYLIQVIQAAQSAGSSMVVGADIGLTVSELGAELKFYRDILGFAVSSDAPFESGKSALRLIGLEKGQLKASAAYIPGTHARIEFYEFKNVNSTPVRLRIQDPGSPQLQLRVRDLDPLIQQVQAAGYTFLSVGAKPIQRAFGRFVFAVDPNGVLVEFVHPAR